MGRRHGGPWRSGLRGRRGSSHRGLVFTDAHEGGRHKTNTKNLSYFRSGKILSTSSGSRRVVVVRAPVVVHGRRGTRSSRTENSRRGRSWRSGVGVVGLRASRSEDLDVGERLHDGKRGTRSSGNSELHDGKKRRFTTGKRAGNGNMKGNTSGTETGTCSGASGTGSGTHRGTGETTRRRTNIGKQPPGT